MARTSPRQGLARSVDVPANLITIKVGFWRKQFAGLLEAKWGLKERVAGYLRGRTWGPGTGSMWAGEE